MKMPLPLKGRYQAVIFKSINISIILRGALLRRVNNTFKEYFTSFQKFRIFVTK
jgi:hypothetical protein